MLDKFRISTRITAGFGLMVALLLGLAALTWVTANGLGSVFYSYRGEARMSFAAAELRDAMRLTQFAVADFRADPTPEQGDAMMATIEPLARRADEVMENANTDAERREAAALQAAVAEFGALLAEYREISDRRVAGTTQLTDMGIEYRRAIGRINTMLEEREATDLAYDALRASEAFLVTRVRIDRFFDGWPAEEFETATGPFQSTSAALERISRGALTAEERGLVAAARDGIGGFLRVAQDTRDAELERRTTGERVNAAVPVVVGLVADTMAHALADQQDLGAAGEERVQSARMLALILAIGTLVVATLVAWAIGRSVTNGTRALGSEIDRLAEGDLSREVPGADRKTELGAMARSLEVLRTRAAAEEEERAARAAGEERRAAFFDGMGRNLGDLAGGNLSIRMARTDHPGVDDMTLRLCDDFNALAQSFSNLITQAQSSATAVQETAAQLAQGSGEMSHRAETQAATLEESAAALDEMTASVK
ncbi:MAG: HAMP domain-containing protein, partial [Alkalilacustris sp.]